MTLAGASTTPPTEQTATRKYRPEIQGLRAVAASLVVIYHVWLGRISGGVDVFFLVSGFLITGQLFRASVRDRIRFRPLWGRMIKRLFPAALTVLLAVVGASLVLLPETRWFQTIREVLASAFYLENWKLARDSVDYFAQHNAASVVQHFWSLSIQGQFYLVWPLLVAVVALTARLVRRSLRTTLLVALAVTFAASLTYSVVLTAADQPLAYFHSLTRVWEFALGGLLALAIDSVTLPRTVRIVLGWIGVLGLVSCGMVLQVGTMFPGYFALWPTLCASFVIAAGATGSAVGADRFLSSKPLEYLGNLSYSLYLWHWPVLVFALIAQDTARLDLVSGLAVIGMALVLSALTYHFVEEPVRRSTIGEANRWGAYRFGVIALVPVILATVAWQDWTEYKANNYQISLTDPDHPGAQAREVGFRYAGGDDVELAPPAVALQQDWAKVDVRACHASTQDHELEVCPSEVPAPPVRRIVVVGDSHIQQYLAALQPVAERNNWQLITMLRGACPFSVDSVTEPGDTGCVEWNAAAVREIVALRPDAVLTLASREMRVGLTEQTPPGFVEQWRKLTAANIPVLAVRDNPRFAESPAECALTKGATAPECTTARADIIPPLAPYTRIADLPANVTFLDFTNYICTKRRCPPVIGNVLVYLDDNHLSASFLTTLSPVLEQQIEESLHW